jgi:hypothetical protein
VRIVRYLGGVIATVLALSPVSASAAELRITLPELANALQSVMGDAKLHLNNTPGGFLSGNSGSTWTIAGKTTAIPLPPKSFQLLGSTYAYHVKDLNSKSIAVSAAPPALRLTLTFEDKAAELKGSCVAGDCGLVSALPKIIWKNGTVTIDVAPVRLGASLALEVKSVSIGGLLSARCDPAGLFSQSACALALTWAKRTIANLKPDIAAKLKAKVNDPATQAAVAEGLKPYLAVGPAGAIAITDVRNDAKSVIVVFQFAGAAGG